MLLLENDDEFSLIIANSSRPPIFFSVLHRIIHQNEAESV